ncbi:MAG: glycosyltransferase family 39 protein [Actinomycetota bacterium]|nr:glycosyltransferase family 39 protein [Actinomycetota bacterium]
MPSFRWRLLILGIAALSVRLFYIFVIAPEPVGVGGDASFYHSAANLIAHGVFYDRVIDHGHVYPTALHPPLFSMLLSVVALAGGVHLLPQRIAACLIGCCSVVLLAVLGRRIANERAGTIAGWVAAVYPPFVTADGSIQAEPLYVLLVVIALLLAWRVVNAPNDKAAIALGAVIGLATLTRTEAVFLLALLAWPAAWGATPGRRVRLLGATAACAIVLGPWVIRNAVVFHKIELSANYVTVISAANCRDTYYGNDIGWWSIHCLRRAQTRNQFHIGDASPTPGLRFIRRHPARAVLVAITRVGRTFGFFQPLRIGNNELRRRWFDALGLVLYYPLLVLAVIGGVRLPARRWLLLAPFWTTLIVTATGWGNARFRIGADISIVLLAAVALAAWRPESILDARMTPITDARP